MYFYIYICSLFYYCFSFRGTAIARIVGNNVKNFEEFDNTVSMYVFEEVVDGRKLSEIINTDHENVKYLPGYKIPDNVVSNCMFIKTYMVFY